MGADQSTINNFNIASVLKEIWKRNTVSRADIARFTELSIPTVMKITDELIQRNLIDYFGQGESSGGKPPKLLKVVNDSYFFLGIDVGTTNIVAIVMDMLGNIVLRKCRSTRVNDGPDKIIERIIQISLDVIKDSGISYEKIVAAGVGMPGLIDITTGSVVFSPDFGWENIRLRNLLNDSLHIPVYMDNVTRAMAIGEKLYGEARGIESFMCINLGYGIGSALVMNNEMYYGNAHAGEFGHITMEKNGPLCACGNRGCLEAIASANAITNKAKELASQGIAETILESAGGYIEDIDARIIYNCAKSGDLISLNIINDSLEYIGIAISGVINLIDLGLIILEGGVSRAGDFLLDRINNVVENRVMKYAGKGTSIVISKLGENAAAIGAASIPLELFLKYGGNRNRMDEDYNSL